MPEVFAALEVLGTGLMHVGSPVGDDALSLDWRVEGVGGVSGSTGVSGDEDPVARRWLLPDGDHVLVRFFCFLQCKFFFDLIDFVIYFQ